MKALRRAHGRTYLAPIFVVWGCSVYEPSLLSEQAASGSGGTTAGAGEAGTGSGKSGAAGAGATGNAGGSGGSAGSSGAASGDAGESVTAAGAETGGEGGETACLPETPAEFCTRLGKDCGSVNGTDNCGSAIVGADCGACSGLEKCGGSGQDNVCGALTDPALGGTPTASSMMFVHEDGSKAFDLQITTKWYAGDSSPTGWLAYQFAGTDAHAVKSYSVTSANDVPLRDPADWQLQGSDDGSTWITVDQQSAQVFASRRQTISYTSANTTPYHHYRLLITANSGAPSVQLSELVLYAN